MGCEDCGNEMELVGSFRGESHWRCPECGRVVGRRLPEGVTL